MNMPKAFMHREPPYGTTQNRSSTFEKASKQSYAIGEWKNRWKKLKVDRDTRNVRSMNKLPKNHAGRKGSPSNLGVFTLVHNILMLFLRRKKLIKGVPQK